MADHTVQPKRAPAVSLPVLAACDVLILGGGFGGVAAALEFARAGRRVMLVEPRTYLGREMTATLRPWLNVAGHSHPLIDSMVRNAASGGGLNLDSVKILLEDTLLDAGVRLLYASLAVGVQRDDSGLQGVVIANKSGRQVIRCRLLLDGTETATIAHLLDEPFTPDTHRTRPYWRTLEFDGVAPDLPLEQPLRAAGRSAVPRPGYRGAGHVLVDVTLDLPFGADDAFSASGREAIAREQTMAFAAALAQDVPAFQSAYLSGASYELCGRHTRRLQPRPASWAGRDDALTVPALSPAPIPLSIFAGAARGVWYLNDALTWPSGVDAPLCDPVLAAEAGMALARALVQRWQTAASATAELAEPGHEVFPEAPELREPASPQRGRPYPRAVVDETALPLLRAVDILVVGGGSSGAIAAITAAREGLRTLLIEMNPGLGGTGTFGGVHSYWFGRREGFAAEVTALVARAHTDLGLNPPQGQIPKWNIEAKSFALLKAAREAGVELLFDSVVFGAVVEDRRVCGVAVATRFGAGLVRARAVIDATGDGDVAAFAGADFVYGSERDHAVMWSALAQFPRPGLTRNHFTSMADVSNIEDLTRAILAGRRRGGKGDMHDHGIYVAPRESRHIRGDAVLTLTDQLRQRQWPDVVNIAFSNHDVKGQSGSDWQRIGLIPPNLEIEIPYRALTPRGLDGILVVGKALSATHDALPAIRMQADLENLGGVAALAAVAAVQTGSSLRALDLGTLQARLVERGVLPARVLARSLAEPSSTDAELRRMIENLPVFPLHEYSDMELTDRFYGLIPLVEICCAGPHVVPLLEAAHECAQGERKLRLAQMLALTGSNAGVPTLIEAILPQLDGEVLPARTAHIRYTQLPPDHGAMPEAVHLLYSLGMTPDARTLPVWQRLAELLADVRDSDFYEDMKGTFYYVDAFGYSAERLASPALIPLLSRIRAAGPFHQRMATTAFEADFVLERLAYLELVLGRALARCGAVEGYLVLVAYLTDNRALLAEHAHTELKAITGEDYGKDASAWSQWIELNADSLVPRPCPPRTEAMDSWLPQTPV